MRPTQQRLAITIVLGLSLARCAAGDVIDPGPTDASGTAHDGTNTEASRTDVASADTRADATAGDTSCAIIRGQADIVRRPLDVIVVVDSTGTFNQPRMTIGGVL